MRTLRAAVVAMVAVVSTAGGAGAQTKLEPCLEIELQRLEETYAVLERFAKDIWPGWTNYLDPEFRVQFPNLVFLIVGPRAAVPDGYLLAEGRTIHGKPVYLNRKEELPIALQPPLGGGGGGGLTIRIRLQQFPLRPGVTPPENAVKGDKPFEPRYDVSEQQILAYVHEFFHGFQAVAIPGRAPTPQPRAPRAAEQPPAPPPTPMRSAPREPHIVVTLDYSTYSNVEALALKEAYVSAAAAQARERLADYLVARHLKQQTMAPREIAFENETQLTEGTALYSDTRMASLILAAGYGGNGRHEGDPAFSSWRGMQSYLDEKLAAQIRYSGGSTLDTLSKYYVFGAHLCFILDRISPAWKTAFFQSQKSLDTVVGETLKLTEADERRIAAGLEARYSVSDVRAKHKRVLDERDAAIALIAGRQGRRYIVDFERTRESFDILPRGKSVRLGVEQIFWNGIGRLTLGNISLTSVDTPMHRPGLWTVEWVDTNAADGVKGYELTCRERAGTECRGAEFKTAGFTLKAPAVELAETGNEVRVTILSKVAR
ncbi:MAG: hypothetical protein EHM24_05090 [Acidobacteria bacterium]|nr:MAG: hypothetical protein EHM24_05090 [Acidobacteriota bacterium]